MNFDSQLFSAMIQARLHQKKISAREAARNAGVSASTMSRLINGDAPDMDTFSLMVKWLEIDANVFLNSSRDAKKDDPWANLYLSLQVLGTPADLIEAIIAIIRLTNNCPNARPE